MIIQIVLVIGLLLCLSYAFMQRKKSATVSIAISLVAMCGIVLVVKPEWSSHVARFVGVGRGADLVMYCWLVISLVISVNLQFKILSLHRVITELARELALRTAQGVAAEANKDGL